jgi:CRISPR-associated protein Csd1
MIIQSLARYYDILSGDETVEIPKWGYSSAKVSFALVISKNGALTNIIDLRSDEKKKHPKLMDVPLQKSRSGTHPPPYFLCDKAEYIFGIESLKPKEFKERRLKSSQNLIELDQNEKRVIFVSPRTIAGANHFRLLHHSLLEGISNPEIQIFLKFLDEWKPEESLKHPKIAEYKEDILNGAFFVFDVGGGYLHEKPELRNIWESHYTSQSDDDSSEYSQCLVSGNIAPIARTHQKIKGVFGAQSAGATLVGLNDPAFWSYKKEQSYNAPVSETAMFKYTTALNHLLDRNSKNRMQIGDTTTVFWAENHRNTCETLAHFFLDPIQEQDDQSEVESNDQIGKQDLQTIQLIRDILQKVRDGKHLGEQDLGVDPEKTQFFILGLSPNNARIAIRYWHQDTFGNFITRVARHHLDMEIERNDRGPKYVSVYRLLKATVPRNSTEKAASPLLGGLLMASILEGTPYPLPMYCAILNRVRVERSIDYVKAGFIKACLSRFARARTKHEEDMMTVSLNEENKNTPYRLGRLFAILESTQKIANPNIKRTIRDGYFASASATPAVVFPILIKLSQHHLSKINSEKPGLGVSISKSMDEVMSSIDQFPVNLGLQDQGMFVLGYYHQHESFFRKGDKPETI